MLFNFILHSVRDESDKATAPLIKNKQCIAYTGAEICNEYFILGWIYAGVIPPHHAQYALRIFTPFSAKFHPKSKNYLPHTFYIISWNLIKIQLWDFKNVVPNSRAYTVQSLNFLAFVLFEWIEKCGVLRKSTPADSNGSQRANSLFSQASLTTDQDANVFKHCLLPETNKWIKHAKLTSMIFTPVGIADGCAIDAIVSYTAFVMAIIAHFESFPSLHRHRNKSL